ncbi:gastrula zinc finger protein XlCGF8.2DB-like, partial [Scleropages formosus]
MKCKSETDEVKTEQCSQSEGSSGTTTTVHEAVDDLLQSNSVKVENGLNIAGDDVPRESFSEQSVVPVTSVITDKVSRKSCHDGVTYEAEKWQCPQCRHVLRSQSQLKVHLQIHSEDKYCCIQCDSTFSQACQLKQHQLVHSGKAPYKCSLCGKCFARRSGFKKHLLLHSGEEPYTCSECGKSFSRGYTLKLHQRIHSGQKASENFVNAAQQQQQRCDEVTEPDFGAEEMGSGLQLDPDQIKTEIVM